MKKVLVIPDIHLVKKDFNTILNYKETNENLVLRIVEEVALNDIDHIILGGDVCDRGYKDDLVTFHSHYNLLSKLSRASKGKNYLVFGNHGFIGINTNLEAYICQPNNNVMYSPGIQMFKPAEPLFYLERQAIIEGVLFSMHSFSKDKVYRVSNTSGVRHVGIYHDDNFLKYMPDGTIEIVQSYADTMFSGVDVAVINHIHNAEKPKYIGNTMFVLPGSLLPTTTRFPLDTVDPILHLPMFECEGGEFTLKYLHVEKGLDNLQFKVDEIKKTKNRLDPLTRVIKNTEQLCFYRGVGGYFEANKVSPEVIETLNLAKTGSLDVETLARLYDKYNGKVEIETNSEVEL